MDYTYIIIPIIIAIVSQAIKLATDGIKGNFDLKNFWITYGGMPSTHSALTVSMTTLVGLRIGFDSAIFAVALVFSLIIMRDAVTFRNLLGKQAELLNQIAGKLTNKEINCPIHWRERMGHSLPEVLVGAGLGAVLTMILSLLLVGLY